MFGKTIIQAVLVLLTSVFWVASMPPFNLGELAYILFVPLLMWVYTKPSWRAVLWVAGLSSLLAWIGILIWLRHVTYIGTVLLAGCLSLYFILWLSYVRWTLPRLLHQSFLFRVVGFLGIAGTWVVCEWLRSILIYGMPMGPLALSQWQKPVLIQIAAWTGAYGVSFFLIFFNCCMAQTFFNLSATDKKRSIFLGWFKADFYCAVAVLISLIFLYLNCLPKSWTAKEEAFAFAVVQPNFPPLLDWDEDYNALRLAQLEEQVLRAQLLEFDILMLPEGVTPDAIKGDWETLLFYESLVASQGRPILTGNLADYSEVDRLYNGIFLMEPETGLNPIYYAKKQLVPFGEYIPEPFQGMLETFGAIQGAFYPGTYDGVIPVELRGKEYAFGALVCYEDMFPTLARETVQAGAEIIYVATNNAWYGEEGGAYFHAAHSVLRAVENRRPIIRCGNAGWTGWIDAYGSVRDVLTDETNSIYFKGCGLFTLTLDKQWQSFTSVYTRYGDWFVWLSATFAVCAAFIREKRIN